ncbi:hypothetical protein V8E36_007246 [Tilletia maclaganii]
MHLAKICAQGITAPGMFATMVVQLPSSHEGGQLLVYNGEDDIPVSHDFGDAAGTKSYQCHYAVHYADSEHAVTPITSGYRMALVYSICWPSGWKDPAPSSKSDVNAERVARSLSALAQEQRQFCYLFEHAYTQKSLTDLGAAALKGRDRNRVAALRAANVDLPEAEQYVFYLGKAEKHHSSYGCGGGYRATDWDLVDPPTTSIKHLLTMEGQPMKIGQAPSLRDGNILNPDKKTSGQLWHGQRSTVYEGYLGNEGPTKDTTYHKYILLAAPQALGILTFLGERAAFDELTKTKPSVQRLELFLRELRSRDSSAFDYEQNHVRAKLLEYITKHKEFHRLALPALRLVSDPKYLTPAASQPSSLFHPTSLQTRASDGRLDTSVLIALMTTQSIWTQPGIQGCVHDLFRHREDAILDVVLRCLDDGIEPALWKGFRQMLDGLQRGRLPPSFPGSSSNHLKKLWSAAIRVDDEILCNLVVKRQNDQPDANMLQATTEALIALQIQFTQQFNTRRHLIEPLVQARVNHIRAERDLLDVGKQGWRMPRANPRLDSRLLEFRRGPEQSTTIRGFKSITQARCLARDWNYDHMQNGCSFKATEGGRAAQSYITVTKTDAYAKRCVSKSSALLSELGRLKNLLKRGEGQASSSVQQAEPDAKRPRLK